MFPAPLLNLQVKIKKRKLVSVLLSLTKAIQSFFWYKNKYFGIINKF